MHPTASAFRRPGSRALQGLLCVALVLACGAAANAATLDIAGPPGTAVRLNGLHLRALPLAGPLTLSPGMYVVEAEMDGYLPFRQTIRLEQDGSHVRLQIRFERLSRRTAWTSSVLFAGLGQFYVGRPVRGWIYAAAEAGGLLTALAGELQRTNHRKDYLLLMDSYNSSINADEVTYYREQAADAYAKMEDAEKMRDTGLIVALAAVGVSVADALFTFPHVAAGPGPVPPGADYGLAAPRGHVNPLTGAHVALTFGF